MPTYRNKNKSTIAYSGVKFLYNQDTPIDFYVPHENLELELVDDKPYVEGLIILSRVVTNDEIEIPYSNHITISAITPNSATLYFADSKEGVHITDSAGFALNGNWRNIRKIKVVGEASIVVEKGEG